MLFTIIGVVWVHVVPTFTGAGFKVHVVSGEGDAQRNSFGMRQGEGLHGGIFTLSPDISERRHGGAGSGQRRRRHQGVRKPR